MTQHSSDTSSLRDGFTTGSAATAAAMAALFVALATPKDILPNPLSIPLPPTAIDFPHKRLNIPIIECSLLTPQNKNALWHAMATVQKDGGDDPDATHKAFIVAHVRLLHLDQAHNEVRIMGGQGIGRITLPGLPLAIGSAAINPSPLAQIRHGLLEIAQIFGYSGGIEVCISVPCGEKIAQKTLNARLGIVGGISILGTQGTVKPYSHAAFESTILQGLSVAKACACTNIYLSTGRRSEKFLQAKYPQCPAQCFVQVADFAKFSLENAAQHHFANIIWACFFGKLIKLAQGHAYTHAHKCHIDFALLTKWCQDAGLDLPEISKCVTAHHALELILQSPCKHTIENVLHLLSLKASEVASDFAQRPISLHLFHLDGRELTCIQKPYKS